MPDSISAQRKKNIDGRIYILCKHSIRWRKVAYSSFIKSARLLWFDADREWKRKIVRAAPEILPILPLAYIKRKLFTN